jgi:hypothetical protein
MSVSIALHMKFYEKVRKRGQFEKMLMQGEISDEQNFTRKQIKLMHKREQFEKMEQVKWQKTIHMENPEPKQTVWLEPKQTNWLELAQQQALFLKWNQLAMAAALAAEREQEKLQLNDYTNEYLSIYSILAYEREQKKQRLDDYVNKYETVYSISSGSDDSLCCSQNFREY